jgi:hypothetical protein
MNMILSAKLEKNILQCVGELHELVNMQGYELTNPAVVNISMKLDLLILKAMRSQRRKISPEEASLCSAAI